MRVRKTKTWSNYGEGTQVYDVCFEVDKLDQIRMKEGKDNEKYKAQHKKAVSLVTQYNSEGVSTISLSQCRAIIQRKPEWLGERVIFFNKTPPMAKTESENVE